MISRYQKSYIRKFCHLAQKTLDKNSKIAKGFVTLWLFPLKQPESPQKEMAE